MENKIDRSMYELLSFIAIYGVIFAGISVAAFYVYSWGLGVWVSASAFVAATTSLFLFNHVVKGGTFMKVVLGLCMAANAAYLVHNGAKALGIDSFNTAQIAKFESGMAQAAKAKSVKVARAIGMNAKSASVVEKAFDDSTAVNASFLAFLELAAGMIIFAFASSRGLSGSVLHVFNDSARADHRTSQPAPSGLLYRFDPETGERLSVSSEPMTEEQARRYVMGENRPH